MNIIIVYHICGYLLSDVSLITNFVKIYQADIFNTDI